MKRQRVTFGLCAALGMSLLIFSSKRSFLGASDGILLCLRTIIPVLFPFFFFSNLLVSSLWGCRSALLRIIGRAFRLPAGAESILIPAFLGGYPAGAQTVSSLYDAHLLPKDQAEYMLAFCNNAGPSFIFGLVASSFADRWISWLIWGVQILGAWFTSRLIPTSFSLKSIEPRQKTISIALSMNNALVATAKVCGWVILFRTLLAFFDPIFHMCSPALSTLFVGLLELSNGCCLLHTISSWEIRLVIANVILSFGGLCVTMQTISVTSNLSLRWYIRGKLIRLVISILLSVAIILGGWSFILALIIILILLGIKNKITVAFPNILVYNVFNHIRRNTKCFFAKK